LSLPRSPNNSRQWQSSNFPRKENLGSTTQWRNILKENAMRLKVQALTLFVVMLIPVSLWAQTPATAEESPEAQVDKIFEKMDKTVSPGCALSVMKDGKIIYERGYGMADLDHNVPITPTTVFHVASMSKQFTDASIVMLAQEGKLSLDDPVRKYVPELPDFGTPITIRELVHHTSGLRDQWNLLRLAGWRPSLDLITDDDVLSVISRQKDLNFPPGSRYLYCNTGYTLLAQIVKRLSEGTFREFTTAHIFQPLGMTRTHFRDDHAEIVKNMAYGYVPAGDTFRISITNFDTVGATSLLTTVEDLALWDENFYQPRVGGAAMIKQMLERGKLNNGEQLDYAFGLVLGHYRGLATVDHGGSDAGYRSDMIRFPDQHFSVACLCNLAISNPSELAKKAADVYLGKEMKPPETPGGTSEKAVQLSEQQLRANVGTYLNPDGDEIRRIILKDGKLRVVMGNGSDEASELEALGEDHFRLLTAPVDIRFELTQPGGSRRLIQTSSVGGKPEVFERVPEFTPSAQELKNYAAVYHSNEIEPLYEIKLEDGKLVLHRLKNKPDTLRPVTHDLFSADVGSIRFKRNTQGQISGLVVNTGRITNLRFEKGSCRTE
jgi:CubicO group peptidase (beta-lactamase class C family)